MKDIKEYIKDIEKCVRCGACKAGCPVFEVKRREPSSPRGRVALIEAAISKKGEKFGGTYLKHIKDCTLCGACYSNCPNGVNVPELVLMARKEYVEKEGDHGIGLFAVRSILSSASLSSWVLKFAGKLQGILFKGAGVENGLISRFSLPFISEGRLVPDIADEFFLERPHIRELKGGGKGTVRVAFFVGCGINYLLPEIGEATVRVLKGHNVNVIAPQGQTCCGMPALSAGDETTARSMALKNLEAFETLECDYIVTSCATCGHGLKNVFRALLNDSPEEKNRVERFSEKVRDITELLERDLLYEVKPRFNEGVVTYHDPCHLRRYQGISEEPRSLLQKTGLNLKGMKNPCKCCGLGGGLAFSNYELSMEIARKKAESIRLTSADIVATACPGCIIQLRDACNRYGVRCRVAHVVELL